MNKTMTFASIAAVAIVSGSILTLTLANASDTSLLNPQVDQKALQAVANGAENVNDQDADDDTQHDGMHQGMKKVIDAVEANDFTAFQAAVSGTPMEGKITTTDQFAQVVQMHTLMQAGKFDEAKAIATELGLPFPKGNHAERQAIKAAVDANDFTAFQTAIADDAHDPLASVDTPEEFSQFVKMHGLLDEAKAIADNLNIPLFEGRGEGKGGERGHMKGHHGFGMFGNKGQDNANDNK